MLCKLTPKDYKTSAWSGGTTTQIAIAPAGADYARRDFLWRVSSATVELEDSDFTPLPDYDRLIATLRGGILLTHNGGPALALSPGEVHAFSGADATHSRGRCTDFNLMLRRGRAEGSMEALTLTEGPCPLSPLRPGETLLVYCAEGTCAGGGQRLAPGETLAAEGPASLSLTGPGRVMVCRITEQAAEL